jgi:choice-of-anchor B domain-containing protein
MPLMPRQIRFLPLRFLPLLLVPLGACSDNATGPGGGIGRYEPLAACSGGQADGYACDRVDLLAHVSLADLEPAANVAEANDIWGWTDPSTGHDYALVGRQNGVDIVDITEPRDPVPVGRVPSTVGTSSWRDIKTYKNHMYVVADGAPGHGMQVFDLRRVRGVTQFEEFTPDAIYTDVSSVHNLVIDDETGFAYAVGSNGGGTTCGGGLHMIDIRNPASPVFAGCFAETGTGRNKTGYTHDAQCIVYDGPDNQYAGREICFGANETALVIADVTDKSAPIGISTASYPDARYVHQGWLTPDRRYFLQNDELDELTGTVTNSRLIVWDVSDLEDPVVATEYAGPTTAIDHNIYVVGNRAYYSNYTYGLRVLDVSDPRNPRERGHFDTDPASDAVTFGGSWSNYPFFDSGVIAVSSIEDGLFLLQLR